MISPLKLKVGVTLLVLVMVIGTYFYIKDLQHTIEVDSLIKQEQQRTIDSYKEKQEDDKRLDEIVAKVDDISSKNREIYRKEYQAKTKSIDTKVNEGKDRPVGPLLKEFFNEK